MRKNRNKSFVRGPGCVRAGAKTAHWLPQCSRSSLALKLQEFLINQNRILENSKFFINKKNAPPRIHPQSPAFSLNKFRNIFFCARSLVRGSLIKEEEKKQREEI